jgi:large subunit ribosomal protein L6
MHEDIIEKIEIPENVDVSIGEGISIKGPKGELRREFPVDIRKEGNLIIIEAKNATKNKKKLIKTARAHINNMIKGVMEGYEYLLQICSVHFPITVTADKESVNIKNFLGETTPRKAKIVSGVQVKIEGDIIKISSPNIESAGQTAANIETATKIKNRDRTRFQDGIWIINKAGEEI